MKTLRQLSAIIVLTFMLTLSAFAGDMSTGRTGEITTMREGQMDTGKAGEIQTGKTGEISTPLTGQIEIPRMSSATDFALDLWLGVLSLI